MKLIGKADADYTIEYKDFVSMYPATMVETAYPLGHPDLEVFNIPVDWTSSIDNPYRRVHQVLRRASKGSSGSRPPS
jgi:hypothetical protein